MSGLTGNIKITGFRNNATLPVEWHTFTAQGIPVISTTTYTTDSAGVLTLPLPTDSSTTDTAVKIGDYTVTKTGDANSDGKVDGVDYMIWFNHYRQSVTGPANGDFNSSGFVDGVDYMLWLNNYGK